MAAAEAAARSEWLWARERVLDDALGQARVWLERFADLPDGPARLEAFIVEGLAVLPDGPVRVVLPSAFTTLLDAAAVRRLGGARWSLEIVPDEAHAPGVVVETADGRLRFDNTFDARLERTRDELRQALAEVLFVD
jgi:V/A-type H+-transporting ATPase subunit E